MKLIQYDVKGSATWQINRDNEKFLSFKIRCQVYKVPGGQMVLVAGTEEQLVAFDDYFDNGDHTYCKVIGFHYIDEGLFDDLMEDERVRSHFGNMRDKLNFGLSLFI